MVTIPESHRDLLGEGTTAFAYLATVMPDGSPQVTTVWFSTDGDDILINTARGRTKERNMRRSPFVALLIADPADPYRYIQVRGSIVEISEAGALEHIDFLSEKYRGRPWKPVSGQVRIICRLRPHHVSTD